MFRSSLAVASQMHVKVVRPAAKGMILEVLLQR
jgi:hypothetical protein